MRIITIPACDFAMRIISVNMCEALRAKPDILEVFEFLSYSILKVGSALTVGASVSDCVCNSRSVSRGSLTVSGCVVKPIS